MTLLARLEAAEVGNRELSVAVCAALDIRPGWLVGCEGKLWADGDTLRWHDAIFKRRSTGFPSVECPDAAQSLDAALALVERVLPGAWFTFGKGRTRPDEPLFGATLFADDMRPDGLHPQLGEGEHEHSLVLAVLIALLKAKGPDHA